MKTGRFGTALALVMVLAIIAATAIGLSVWPASGGGNQSTDDHGDPIDWQPEPSPAGGLQRFASYEEMAEFLEAAPEYPGYWYVNDQSGTLRFGTGDSLAAAESTPDYSRTNIQVEGVDEADIVKTDGQYIYLAVGNRLIIARAYPPGEARVVWERKLDGSIQGLFINGDSLAVLQSAGPLYATGLRWGLGMESLTASYNDQTSIRVYDVTDREEPDLQRELSVDGYCVSARMIGDYVYLIASGSVWRTEDDVDLPRIDGGSGTAQIAAEEVWHSETPDNGYCFTTIMSVNVTNSDEEARHQTLLVGSASTVYVSPDNIYVTFPDWSATSGKTSIHRIHVDLGRIEYHATGEVPGSLLNQFSMDESGGYLRVATTDWNWATEASSAAPRQDNNVYVLDQDLDIFGRLENVAPNETIHAARFMGHRCYLVTFEQTDPLFVIDLTDPGHPQILGELVMPGYSDYLHPYDENHLIGIGMLGSSVKISLYDVTDTGSPEEMSTYLVGGDSNDGGWSSTPVLDDHRAFLFDRERGLLVLPVSSDRTVYRESKDMGYYDFSSWQGAYVFDVSLNDGLELRGRISHCSGETGGSPDTDYELYYGSAIERSLYIGDVLYTISYRQIGMNDLETLAEIGEISLE